MNWYIISLLRLALWINSTNWFEVRVPNSRGIYCGTTKVEEILHGNGEDSNDGNMDFKNGDSGRFFI